MNKTKLLKNKNGVTKLLGVSIDLVITFAVILILFVILLKLYAIFTAKPNQGTMESFLMMDSKIKNDILKDNKANFEIPFYVQDTNLVVAFNRGEAYAKWRELKFYPKWLDASISRPASGECSITNNKNGACLCLCKNEDLNEDACRTPWKCFLYKDIDAILVSKEMKCNYGVKDEDYDGNYFVLIGDRLLSTGCGVRQLSAELKEHKIYVTISE